MKSIPCHGLRDDGLSSVLMAAADRERCSPAGLARLEQGLSLGVCRWR
jgi:hypothetical protein